MKDTYVSAKLVAPDLIRLVVFSSLPWERIEPQLVTDGVPGKKMAPTKLSTMPNIAIADFRLPEELELGHSYFLVMPQYGALPLNVDEATTFPDFDRKYFYGGNDLGAIYSKESTCFNLWAPLASKVVLVFRKDKQSPWKILDMKREPTGVFRLEIGGDLEGWLYHYWITNSETARKATDPYAKASTQNGEESVVVDFNKLKTDFKRDHLPVMQSPTDAVIYEAHVRDMTIDPSTDIVHKGRFLGMIEKGRKTEKGHPAGFDYLKSLGFTHIQLLPIYDYITVDETDPSTKYNWGYDPAQYFVPEGSYASDLGDPLSRIKDCKRMVQAFHEEGIRVVMDVVFNHVFEYEKSVFEKVVPNFYFRKRNNGKMASTSGCGNDLASERPMVRKMIVDACRHWIEEYGIDGFRFDLMGIIDIETLQQIQKMARSHDKSFLLYGEGWNMGGEVKTPLGHMGNYSLMPEYAFFNDFYRENGKAYFSEDIGAKNSFKNAYLGSCLDFEGSKRFLDATQTINYVECHDNGTFFDILAQRRSDLPEEERLKLIQVATAGILCSFGIPLIHMGQEIGQSKWGEDNTYNKGDGFNKFSYRLLDERFEMAEFVKNAISLRRKNRFFHLFDPRVILDIVDVVELGNAIRVKYIEPNVIAPYKKFEVIMNPTYETLTLPEDAPKEVVLSSFIHGKGPGSITEIPPRSFVVLKA